jgi:hypothetical protein
MTQQLGPGTALPRKRALFGLLDADGWSWAGLKAFAWLIFIIFILAYIPDRAYYFTVNRTIDLGILAWSPVNLCPADPNEDLPCPAPVGAVTPWHLAPDQLALPEARTDGAAIQLGTNILFIGGSDGQAAQADVFVAPAVETGNFAEWEQGPALPEPRANASVVFEGGSIYVFGGEDADGAPTTTAYVLTPNAESGDLGEWQPADDGLVLPEARAGAAIATSASGLLLAGGTGPDDEVVATTWLAALDEDGNLGAWEEQAPLNSATTDATAASVGDFVWVWGGSDAGGQPVGGVQRGEFGAAAAEGEEPNPDAGKLVRWGVQNQSNLPVARTNAAGWSANGVLYLAGGNDGSSARPEVYWAVPTGAGNIPEWKHLDVSDLGQGIEGAAPLVTGPNAVLIGGQTSDGVTAASARASIAPQAPFFQLGLVGATVPALKIDGEVGQQLGYLNAAGAGTVNFVLLLLIGWAYAHKEQTRAMVDRFVRRRRAR